jgi:hypothetical protein
MAAVAVTVAALYVETGGAYFGLPDVDPWDEARDARLYDGPHPVVAHPPCNRWCSFAPQIEKVRGYRVGDDGGCFEAALEAVRTFGGVLEHPADSLAWPAFDLPEPTVAWGWTTSLLDGGASCYVEQGRYGHPMKKGTWLYAFGVELPDLRWGKVNDNAELGRFKWGSRLYKPGHDRERPRLSAREHSASPDSFRDELLSMARSAARVEAGSR